MTRTLATTTGAAVLLAALGVLAAGCGGGSRTPGVAQIGTTTATTASAATSGSTKGDPAKFSRCMRAHGVPSFPDPDSRGGLRIEAGPGTGIDPGSATFRNAQKACQKYAPHGTPSPAQAKAMLDQALRFSACMRSHGVPKFPDPQSVNGGAGIRLSIRAGQGIDPGSPVFQAAQKACQNLVPGAVPGAARTGTGSSTSGGKVTTP